MQRQPELATDDEDDDWECDFSLPVAPLAAPQPADALQAVAVPAFPAPAPPVLPLEQALHCFASSLSVQVSLQSHPKRDANLAWKFPITGPPPPPKTKAMTVVRIRPHSRIINGLHTSL